MGFQMKSSHFSLPLFVIPVLVASSLFLVILYRLQTDLHVTGLQIVLISGICLACFQFLFFLDIGRTVISFVPGWLAFLVTLGTLHLTGHPPGTSELMLSEVILLLTAACSTYRVRSWQELADPPSRQSEEPPQNGSPDDRVLQRYRNAGAYQRQFSRFKLRMDPMFSELPSLLTNPGIRTVADIGCGYGVPSCWILERFADATVYAIDPDPVREFTASRAMGTRGRVSAAAAPEIPKVPCPVDVVMMLDMIHFLNDDEMHLTLKRLSAILDLKGCILVRAALPPAYRFPWVWWLENLKYKLSGVPYYYRTGVEIEKIIHQAGLDIELTAPSGSRGDLVWLILKIRKQPSSSRLTGPAWLPS